MINIRHVKISTNKVNKKYKSQANLLVLSILFSLIQFKIGLISAPFIENVEIVIGCLPELNEKLEKMRKDGLD